MVPVSPVTPLDPLSVEQNFRALLQRLSYPWSSRKQLTEVEGFLRSMTADPGRYESYVLEIAQRIPDIVSRLNVLGVDPETLRPLYEELKELIIALPSLSNVKGLSDAMQKLRQAIAILYHFVGKENLGSEFEFEESVAREITLSAAWAESILVPVVERSLVDVPGSLHENGYLRKISIEITGVSKSGADVFYSQSPILGQHGGLTNTLVGPILAARSRLAATEPSVQNRYFNGFVTFDELNAFHQGSSANFAIAALLYCMFLSYVGARTQYRLNRNVTMTGDIDENGIVLPVDSDSLKLKTEAVFFSDIRFFVVPKSQLSIAEAVVQPLCHQYPKRSVTIIGVSRLQEVFYDRRLSSESTTSAVGHTFRKAWRNRLTIAAMATIALLLLIVARTVFPRVDDNPVSAEIKGERLLIKNDAGETLEEIQAGLPTITLATASDGRTYASKVCKFYDINGDKKNEFIYVTNQGGADEDANSLICRALWRKLPRWQISFHESASFPQNPVDNRQLLLVDDFVIGRYERNRSPEVFVIAHHVFFPGVVCKVDAVDGKVLGTFLNIGHLSLIEEGDTVADGIREILVAGWNSAYNCSCVCVFDPRFVSGHSPLRGSYTTTDSSRGTEMYYILIPSSIVGTAFQSSTANSGPSSISFDRSERSFSVNVLDVNVHPPDPSEALVGTLILAFDRGMNIINVNSTSVWDRAAEVLVREGKLRRTPDASYLNNDYKKRVLYWDGEHWQNTPTMNKYYLQALRQLSSR